MCYNSIRGLATGRIKLLASHETVNSLATMRQTLKYYALFSLFRAIQRAGGVNEIENRVLQRSGGLLARSQSIAGQGLSLLPAFLAQALHRPG